MTTGLALLVFQSGDDPDFPTGLATTVADQWEQHLFKKSLADSEAEGECEWDLQCFGQEDNLNKLVKRHAYSNLDPGPSGPTEAFPPCVVFCRIKSTGSGMPF